MLETYDVPPPTRAREPGGSRTDRIIRRLRTPAIFAALGFVILLLVLNLLEAHYYPESRLEPPPPDAAETNVATPLGISDAAGCRCVCPDCRHAVRQVSGRMAMRVVDENGWYRLFWAGRKTLYYTDPSFFFVALENSTCVEPAGTWSVTVSYDSACAGRDPVLFCFDQAPAEVRLEYRLTLVDALSPPEFVADPRGLIRIPKRVLGPGREVRRMGKVVFIEWELSRSPEVSYASCRCPR